MFIYSEHELSSTKHHSSYRPTDDLSLRRNLHTSTPLFTTFTQKTLTPRACYFCYTFSILRVFCLKHSSNCFTSLDEFPYSPRNARNAPKQGLASCGYQHRCYSTFYCIIIIRFGSRILSF